MTTLRVNVHQIYAVAEDPENPEGEPIAQLLDGPLQLVWHSACPEEIVLRFGDGEYSLARSQFFTFDDFPEGSTSGVMNLPGGRLVFKTPADEPGYSHLTLSDRAEEIKQWVWNTHAQEVANPAPSTDFDAELARLLEGTL